MYISSINCLLKYDFIFSEYLKNLVKEKEKFIVFAHHQVMMSAISNLLKNLKVGFIKIDGSTKNDLRTVRIKLEYSLCIPMQNYF